ncbi:restriction endonuclease subunit S [Francisella salimarina]|uniref:restriction endonuclease subunit S n=1 Tax=Francisella salimarina TaxID=2599927 RepID=UPI003D813A20
MKSNYKKLGNYIQLVDVRNKELKDLPLVGVTVNKKFISSVANTIGTNMKGYKIIKRNQFACSLMQVRRDGKIPVALFEDEEAIISQAYPVFEIVDENKLLPQYLMMWMSRSEFDREACFYAVGGVRGSLEWEDFCAMELPIPSIEKQREIVAEYYAITNRIKLNEQLNQKLEETAQTLYKKLVTQNQCKDFTLKDFCSFQEGYVNPSQKYTNYFDGNIKWLRANDVNGGFILNTSRTLTNEGFESAGGSALLFNPQTIVITKSGTIGRLGILVDYMCGNRAIINIKPKEENNMPFIFFSLKNAHDNLIDLAVGSAQLNLYVPILGEMKIEVPDTDEVTRFNSVANSLLELMKLKTKENQNLIMLKDLIFSKMATVEG